MLTRRLIRNLLTGTALLALPNLMMACATPIAVHGGWADPMRSLGDVAVCFEPIGQHISAEPVGLRDAIREAFLESQGVTSVSKAMDCGAEDESTTPQTIAHFSLRTRERTVNGQLLPWPSLTMHSELRYRLRLIDPKTGNVWTDADRSLIRHGIFAFRGFDAEAIATDLERFLAALQAESPLAPTAGPFARAAEGTLP